MSPGIQIFLIIAPLLLIAGWIIALRVDSLGRIKVTKEITEEEWEAAWRYELSADIQRPLWSSPAVLAYGWMVADNVSYGLAVVAIMVAIFFLLEARSLYRVAQQVRMGWTEAKSTKWAVSVRQRAMTETIKEYGPNERFGDNGEVIR